MLKINETSFIKSLTRGSKKLSMSIRGMSIRGWSKKRHERHEINQKLATLVIEYLDKFYLTETLNL